MKQIIGQLFNGLGKLSCHQLVAPDVATFSLGDTNVQDAAMGCFVAIVLQSLSSVWLFATYELALCIKRPECWCFSFTISPSSEYSGLISFRIEWLDLLAVSKGLSRVFSNTTVQKHQFFGAQLSLVQLSHPSMTTGKTLALTRWTFVSKIMSLLFNMLSRLVISFLPRSVF